MTDLLLATKIFIPSLRTDWVSRPRLVKSMAKALDHPLTVISAPPGFGKTTLLAEWARSLETGSPAPRLAFVALDADDNDFGRFWSYVLTALQRSLPDGGRESFEEIIQLLKTAPPPYQVFLTILINGIANIDNVFVLVLDDYHTIQSRSIHDSLAYLIDHQPGNFHLVIASRTDLALPMGRWRARGQLNNVRAQDLRFSTQEADEFLNGSMGLSLSGEHVDELERRTEGWIAGLQMAAVTLQEQDESGIAQTIKVFSGRHHFLLDYFTDEILNRQTEEIQRFLLNTSILNRMCAGLCTAVLEHGYQKSVTAANAASAQAALEYLERTNLFVVPLDTERRWYRYHHLFADLLRARLRQNQNPEDEAELHRRAAWWYRQNGFLSESVGHSLQSQAFELAAETIEAAANSLRIWDAGEVATLIKWIDSLPPEVIRDRLWLRMLQSRSIYFTGKADASEAILDEIEQRLAENPAIVPDARLLLGYLLSHRARYASVRGEVNKALEISRQALETLAPNDHAGRNWVLPTQAYAAFLMGDTDQAVQLFTESVDVSKRIGSRFGVVGTLANLARARTVQGRLSEAIRISEAAIREGTIQGMVLPATGWPYYALAEAQYEQNRLDEAETNLREGLRLVRLGNLTDYYGLMPALLARICLIRKQKEEARRMMEEALESARRSTVSMYVSWVEAYRVRVWLGLGEIEPALRWAEGYIKRSEAEYLSEIEEISLAQAYIASGKADQVRARLTPLAEDAQRRGRLGREIEMRLFLALACHNQGDSQAAREALERALQLGETDGFIRPFLELGEPLAQLIQELAIRAGPGISQAYLNDILTAFHPGEYLPSAATPGVHPSLIETLTPREMDVLRLLAEGLSNREIAGRLYLSPNTMRVYTTNIYAKLDVHNRTQAVTKAQGLGLIG